MIPAYDAVANEIASYCSTDCWKRPRTNCPFYGVCMDKTLRTDAQFESALVARYMEMKGEYRT